jgi:hypothetical protein
MTKKGLMITMLWLLLPFLCCEGKQILPLVPHHVQKQRRGLSVSEKRPTQYHRRDAAKQVAALFQGFGTHYAGM